MDETPDDLPDAILRSYATGRGINHVDGARREGGGLV
jgi:hypothetical protein